MVSTFTPNIQIEEPARGDDVGTWDTPVNANMSVLDLILGGTAAISLNNSNVVLSAAQFQCQTITFNSTLTASVTITFPTSFKKPYIIQNQCTGSSAFTITLATTAAGAQVICCPPGEAFDCLNDGSNIKFKNFGRIGSYWDYAGSSVPNWVSGCTVPPYLNCDGTAFSSATYPYLSAILGGTTLPDSRGRLRAYLNQGTGRITSSAGVDGNTLAAAGGGMTTLSNSHLPQLFDPGHQHTLPFSGLTFFVTGGGGNAEASAGGNSQTNTSGTGISYGSSSPIPVPMPPMTIGGLSLIRAG